MLLDLEARQILTESLAFENANSECKRVIAKINTNRQMD